ncbi:substrate-binding domain-containing protein [Aquirufa rosea]|uniref:Sugar ABC transporter substrate-binding protein n=1 Tax=Aquirufa rosea TaxID=2509241 RepID=A0A4Q1BY06_9BACT|nr:substrate-binding domain-containing protein [Aquirufa rosea]RXK47608.1 sugar ABC transporter substrate-binding protein [Aquirufa rosea]
MKLGIRSLLSFLFVALLLACGSKESSGEKKKIVIGVSMLSLQNEFIQQVSASLEKHAKDADVELIVVDAERSALKQVEQVENFISQQVDAIILNPAEFEASSPAILRARKAGIPIVNVNSSTKEKPDAWVGSDDAESAKMAIDFLAKKLNGKGNILMIQGYMGQAAQIDRERGAMEALKAYPQIKLLATQTGEWDRAKSMALMENWIQSYGDQIQGVFAHNDEMGLGAMQALMDAKKKDKVVVVSVDGIGDALKAVQAGNLDATILQNAEQQGAQAIAMALDLINKKPIKESQVLIPFQVKTQ